MSGSWWDSHMFPNKRSRTISSQYPSTMASNPSSKQNKHQCAVCAFTRRKATGQCRIHLAIFKGVMNTTDYETIFRSFGTKVVTRALGIVPPHQQLATLQSFLFEAKSRLLNPVHGGISRIESIEKKLEALQFRVFELEIKLISGIACNNLGETLAPPGGFVELLASICPGGSSSLIPPTLDVQTPPASNEGTSNPFKAFFQTAPSVYPTMSDYQSCMETFQKSPSQISPVCPSNLNQGGSSNFDIGCSSNLNQGGSSNFDIGCSSNLNLDSTANIYSSNMLSPDLGEFTQLSQQEIEELLSFDISDLPNPDSLPYDYGLGDISNNLGGIDIDEFIGTTSSVVVTKETEVERQDIEDEAQESEE